MLLGPDPTLMMGSIVSRILSACREVRGTQVLTNQYSSYQQLFIRGSYSFIHNGKRLSHVYNSLAMSV